jgi:hypothetical protein
MTPWKLSIFSPEPDVYPVRDWYDEQADAVKAEFDVAIQYFRADAGTHGVVALKKKPYVGLHAISVTIQDGGDEVEFGVMGSFRPDSSEFVLFAVCNRYTEDYFSCMSLVLKYRQAWEDGDSKGGVDDYENVMGQTST